ncbi:hypothetical protein MAPG_11368 [Magnaporthiopsis poae ATCC 64411]|uniref:Uncharacterized protein n=1 Tax=Magnaporthiopsis poae (strain ATCC 64411 / 73-15) TaxID=644358 RepID=A0A0C4EF33_MAGP6|nr:hypothetical protein MAPG_11368 [Magnaporthiopsis poae ATCC 64411]
MIPRKIANDGLDDEPDESNDGGNIFSGAALVPTDVKYGGAYLSLYQLGTKVKSMVDKELRVTLVLDCCYSGRGIRGDCSDAKDDEGMLVRGVDAVDDSVLESDYAADGEAALEAGGVRGMKDEVLSWLEQPSSCTILTACGVEETAGEDRFVRGSKERNGVLTHWILHTLEPYPARRPPSYKTVLENVVHRIGSWLPKRRQTPGLFGDVRHEFFGQEPLLWMPSCRVFEQRGTLFLAIGRAQGVAAGATYKPWPADRHGGQDHNPRPLQLRISEAFDLRAKVKPVQIQDAAKIRRAVKNSIAPSSTRGLCRRKTVVRVASAPLSAKLEPPLLDGLRAALAEELETTRNLVVLVDAAAAPALPHARTGAGGKDDLRLVVDEQHDVEIQDCDGQRLPWLPAISLGRAGAAKRLARLVQHVARFRAIKALRYGVPEPENRLPPEQFKLAAYDEDGVPLPKTASGDFEARSGQRVKVELTDVGKHETAISAGTEPLPPVYGVIFHLSDQFGILQKSPPRGYPPFQLFRSDTDRPFVRGVMEIPAGREKNPAAVRDTFRAYVYSGFRRPSWDELELLELDAGGDGDGDGYDGGGVERGMIDNVAYPEDGKWAVLDLTIVTV